jgi:hypothetical protein
MPAHPRVLTPMRSILGSVGDDMSARRRETALGVLG